jgi:hypothetical protein
MTFAGLFSQPGFPQGGTHTQPKPGPFRVMIDGTVLQRWYGRTVVWKKILRHPSIHTLFQRPYDGRGELLLLLLLPPSQTSCHIHPPTPPPPLTKPSMGTKTKREANILNCDCVNDKYGQDEDRRVRQYGQDEKRELQSTTRTYDTEALERHTHREREREIARSFP